MVEDLGIKCERLGSPAKSDPWTMSREIGLAPCCTGQAHEHPKATDNLITNVTNQKSRTEKSREMGTERDPSPPPPIRRLGMEQ